MPVACKKSSKCRQAPPYRSSLGANLESFFSTAYDATRRSEEWWDLFFIRCSPVTHTWNNTEKGEGGFVRRNQLTTLSARGYVVVADQFAERIIPGNVEDYRGEPFGTTAIYLINLVL